jgi:hypothetical protein
MKEMCEYLKIKATEDQLIAGSFLESRGLRFCCEFGTDNAIEKADKIFFEECLLLAIEPESSMIQ